MSNKKSADINLAKEQFFSLNKKFYINYPCDYFLSKLQEVLIKISQPENFIDKLNNTSIEIGKLKTKISWDSADEIQQYAKIELSELYMHCLETFLRVFIARAKLGGCDWLELNRMSTNDYHAALKKIIKGNFNWLNKTLSEEMTIQYALTGIDLPTDEINIAAINNWKRWIVDCAFTLSDIKVYNAYKLGLTLHASKGGFSIQSEGEEKTYGKHGDTISYLVRKEKKDRYVWAEKTEFVDIDICSTKIFVFANLLSNMIKVGRCAYTQEKMADRWYPNENFTLDMFNDSDSTIEGFFSKLSSYSIELAYYANDASKKS